MQRVSRKLYCSALALFLIGSALTGCGSAQNQEPASSDNKSAEVEKTDSNLSGSEDDSSKKQSNESSAKDKSDNKQSSKDNQANEDSDSTESEKSNSNQQTINSNVQNESADDSSADSSQKSAQTESTNSDASDTLNNTKQNVQQLMASEISGRIAQAFNERGYSTTPIEFETSDTGNEVAYFEAEVEGGQVDVFVTSANSAQMAKKTFDANVLADKTNGMAIMNDWENNGNTVYVIRNNMANMNFVEVLDTKQSSAIHIADQLPEQLDPVLKVLDAVSYPVQ